MWPNLMSICLEGQKKTAKNSVNTAHVRSELILCMHTYINTKFLCCLKS